MKKTASEDLPLHVYRDIDPGEVFRHDKSVVIHGNVGRGARVDIRHGGVEIKGDVGDGVQIRTRCKSPLATGITITGAIGDDAVLDTPHGIDINGAGDRLRVRGGHSVSLGHIGDGLNLRAGAGVLGGSLGRNAHIRASGSCNLAQVGHGSAIHSSGVVVITRAGRECRIDSNELYAEAIGAGTTVRAGHWAQIGLAHAFSRVSGKTVNIRMQSGYEKDFELREDGKWRGAFSAYHFGPPKP